MLTSFCIPLFRKKNSLVCRKIVWLPFSAKRSLPISWRCASCRRFFTAKIIPTAGAFLTTGTEATVSKMTREDLVKFHETWFKPNNATLLIVGDTTLAEVTPKLERLFASWKAGEVREANDSVGSRTGKRCRLSPRSSRLGSESDSGCAARAGVQRSRSDISRTRERHIWRELQLPHQHEPARRQALVLRGALSLGTCQG